MDTMETILHRRSTRKYTKEPVPEEKLKKILLAGLLAPTSQNRKPCEFYVIRNQETLEQLSRTKKFGAAMLKECTAAIAVFADSAKADTWMEDASIAMSYMNLEAVDQGVGVCWCQICFRSSLFGKDAEESVRKILNIANDHQRIVGILALGMPAEEPQPHTEQDADWNKVHEV